MPAPPPVPPVALFLVTPRLADTGLAACFREVLAATPVASALLRLAPGSDAKAIVPSFVAAASARDCALILEGDPRLAARLGADGVQVEGAGAALEAAIDSLKPERIVGSSGLRSRDNAMEAGEKGADYLMFGEPRGDGPAQPLDVLVERIGWWADIFETPCVGWAESIDAAAELARAGADFVALEAAVWRAPNPVEAIQQAEAAIRKAQRQRTTAGSDR